MLIGETDIYAYVAGMCTFAIGSVLIIGLDVIINHIIHCFHQVLGRARSNKKLF